MDNYKFISYMPYYIVMYDIETSINYSGAETGIFQENHNNNTIVNAQALYLTKPSACMVIILCSISVYFLHKGRFLLPVPARYHEMTQTSYNFLQIIQHIKH